MIWPRCSPLAFCPSESLTEPLWSGRAEASWAEEGAGGMLPAAGNMEWCTLQKHVDPPKSADAARLLSPKSQVPGKDSCS